MRRVAGLLMGVSVRLASERCCWLRVFGKHLAASKIGVCASCSGAWDGVGIFWTPLHLGMALALYLPGDFGVWWGGAQVPVV